MQAPCHPLPRFDRRAEQLALHEEQKRCIAECPYRWNTDVPGPAPERHCATYPEREKVGRRRRAGCILTAIQ